MRMLIIFALILAPALSFAQTDCRSVELPDRFEAVCTGDEKAIPAPETPSTAAGQYREQQQTAPQQIQEPVQTPAAPPVQPQSAAAAPLPSQTSQAQTSPGTVVHRQGRQQYKKGMDEARAARQQLISDLLQQSQPAQ